MVIVWLMLIHAIGEQNRKGSLGSPYAMRDYYSVNSEFGSLNDLKHFVQVAHELGLYVILDWLANHTAWDNHLVVEHPEWYVRDWKGNFRFSKEALELDGTTQLALAPWSYRVFVKVAAG